MRFVRETADYILSEYEMTYAGCWSRWFGSLFACAGLLVTHVAAQDYTFQRLSVEHGLSQSVVQALHQDDKGYVWIGTQAGLNRYDGTYFLTYSIGDGLPSDYINDIIAGQNSDLWIATNNGIARWAEGQGFETFTSAPGVPDTPAHRLALASNGILWIGTGNGLAYWDGTTFRNIALRPTGESIRINALAFDATGRLWVGTREGLWVSTAEPTGRYEQRSTETVMALRPDPMGRMWVAFREHLDVIHHDKRIATYGQAEGIASIPIQDILHVRDGTTVALTLNGMALIDGDDLTFLDEANGRPFMVGLRLIEDHEGTIWIGSVQGLNLWAAHAFTTYREGSGVPSSIIRPIMRDSKGILWVGTRQGLHRFDGPSPRTFTEDDGLNSRYIRGLFEDSQGRLWIGSYSSLSYYANGRFTTVSIPGASDFRPFSFVEDQQGRIWVAGHRGGIFRQSSAGFVPVEVEGQSFGNPRLLKTKDGRIWASGDRGLSVWDGTNWHTYTTEDGLAANAPYFMAEDSKGRIWFGYHGSYGATLFDGDTFRTYTTEDGLTSNTIYLVGVDAEDAVWLGSASGVDRFVGQTVVNYGVADGFADNETNAGGFFLDTDSTLWFGTMGGLSHYDPRKYTQSSTPPRIRLQDISLGAEPIPAKPISIQVPFTQNDFHAQIAILSFANPKSISWRYRLNGYDTAWRTRDGRDIDYTNLRAGTYTLSVQAKRKNTDWSEAAVFPFEIERPFWQTLWFGLLVIWGLGALVIGIVRFRVRQVETRSRELEKQVKARTAELRTQKTQVEHAFHELQLVEAKLKQANADLMEADRLKSQFLANMSHEIRTPMNGVLGMTEVLLGLDLDEEQRSCTEVIHRSGESLLTIINDILDFSKIEAGKLTLEHVAFDLHELIEDSLELFAARAEHKGLILIGWLDKGPGYVMGDPHRLRQVVANLLSNAIKFTEYGEVFLTTRQTQLDNQRAQWQISVRDSGIGIPDEALPRLFRSFAQVDGSTTRRFGGTGLGLAISKQLVEMMGGHVSVESTVGVGSTFTLTLPLAKAPNQDPYPLQDALHHKHALLLIQHPKQRDVVQAYLADWGMQITVPPADALSSAIDALPTADQPFDVCICEAEFIEQPGKTLSSLRLEPMPKVYLRAHVQNEREPNTAPTSWPAIRKPIRRKSLYSALQSALAETPHLSSHQDPVLMARAPDSRGHLLLVEDNAMNRRVAKFHLDALGYTFDVATNGQEAIDALQATAYDVVLMDVHMPVLDGFEATAAIRTRTDAARDVPIIAMTANAMLGERARCIEAGMSDYLSKPFKRDVLGQILAKWTELTSPPVSSSGDGASNTEVAPPSHSS